jgi:hypothetical protein
MTSCWQLRYTPRCDRANRCRYRRLFTPSATHLERESAVLLDDGETYRIAGARVEFALSIFGIACRRVQRLCHARLSTN